MGRKEEAMTFATIEVSAEFGGRDAHRAISPHFLALKSALKGKSFRGFPFPQLDFILRVDGEVSSYGLSGAGNVRFDRTGVSVDIGITRDLAGRGAAEISDFVAGAILSSVSLLRGLGKPRLKGVDWGALETVLQAFSDAYKVQIAQG
jgi:hypothetical protein